MTESALEEAPATQPAVPTPLQPATEPTKACLSGGAVTQNVTAAAVEHPGPRSKRPAAQPSEQPQRKRAKAPATAGRTENHNVEASDSGHSETDTLRQATPDGQQQPCLPSKDSPSSPINDPAGQPILPQRPSPQHGQHHHHHHDALEEMVFSPTFHMHHESPTPPSPSSQLPVHDSGDSPLRAAVRRSPRHSQHTPTHSAAREHLQPTHEADSSGAAASAAAPAVGGPQSTISLAHTVHMALLQAHHHAGCQLHAIDLNVVEGVDVDDADDSPRAEAQRVAAVDTHHDEAAGIRAEGEDLGDECEEEDEYMGHDENAFYPPSLQQQQQAQQLSLQQQQQHHDRVLVASAPRYQAALPPAGPDAATSALQSHDEMADEDEDEGEFLEFDPLLFIKQLPPLGMCVPQHRAVLLPRQTRACCNRKTLVLDLDETLVHSSLEAVDRADFSFPVTFNGAEHVVYVRQRPHLHDFMERVAGLFEVVVFTASQKIYAEKLLNILDPTHSLVKHRIYRDSCVVVDGNYLKDLSVLGRDLAHTVIVDNSPQAFGFQVDNGVPIESWYDDDADCELLKLLPFLESLVDVDDVRPNIRKQFRLQELIDQAGDVPL